MIRIELPAHLRTLGYRNYPGLSSAEAKAAKDAFERRSQ